MRWNGTDCGRRDIGCFVDLDGVPEEAVEAGLLAEARRQLARRNGPDIGDFGLHSLLMGAILGYYYRPSRLLRDFYSVRKVVLNHTQRATPPGVPTVGLRNDRVTSKQVH